MSRARLSLMGLSVGDALGERFFGRDSVVERAIAERTEPPGPWSWTDDTAMALSIVATLERFGDIDADFLARAFARRYELAGGLELVASEMVGVTALPDTCMSLHGPRKRR